MARKEFSIKSEVDPNQLEIEEVLETTLRPRILEDFIGQSQLKEHMNILLTAARQRSQAVDHLLFAGPPGLGKTSLASIVAVELGVGFRIASGPALARGGDLAAILNELNEGDIFFIDEIHRLPKAVEEVLYPAMEDYKLDIVIGKGPTARAIRLDLPPFTLIGATTRAGLVAAPLRDRFGFIGRLEYYEPFELKAIIQRTAKILTVQIDEQGAQEIATRSRATPRIANKLLRRVRDFAEVKGYKVINQQVASEGLGVFGVDKAGLDKVDIGILEAVCVRFSGGPVGISTLATSIGEEPETIEEVYEPYLLRLGMLARTPRGRVATSRAWEHLGLQPVEYRTPKLLEP